MVIDHFREAGFRVGVNDPYSNSMRVSASIPTLMIEFNKAIYLQADGKTLCSDAYKKNFILKQLSPMPPFSRHTENTSFLL